MAAGTLNGSALKYVILKMVTKRFSPIIVISPFVIKCAKESDMLAFSPLPIHGLYRGFPCTVLSKEVERKEGITAMTLPWQF